jgi:MFS family permease
VSLRARDPRLAVATVLAEGFLGRLAFGMLSFAFPLYALSLGLSVAQIGILVSLRSVFVLPLKPVAGWLSDRIGVRTVYLSGASARTVAAALLFVVEGFVGLMFVRLLQGASAAGRDVASIGVIARDAEGRVATAYSWYASAKHVGGVAGAGIAGLIIAASGGGYRTLFAVVLVLSILPLMAAWFGLQEVSDGEETEEEDQEEGADAAPGGRMAEALALTRELSGPASVGVLVASSAFMVHGLFPVLATEYAGLTAAQAGLIYSLSAAVFLVTGPTFGWIIDRRGRTLGIAWRSVANIGSSFLYLLSPTFAGLAAARSVDDSGKAAFKPAWASAMAEISAADPKRRGKRLGVLDTSQSLGEAIGPALAGILWQTGGIVALFGVRIAIAVAAEVSAIKVFGEFKGTKMRPSSRLTALSYLLPPVLGLAASAGWLAVYSSGPGLLASPLALGAAGALALSGILGGALLGRRAHEAERRAAREELRETLGDIAHDVRGPLTVVRGEVELVLASEDAEQADRERSREAVVREVERMEQILRQRREEAGGP